VTHLYNPPFNNEQVAVRKIFCFFVVNPKIRITSTLHVPMQQWECLQREQARLLCLIAQRLGVSLPKDVVLYILSFAKVGFSQQEAQDIREKLIKERKFETDELNKLWERKFSLCEH
jgi:hypothetical protein